MPSCTPARLLWGREAPSSSRRGECRVVAHRLRFPPHAQQTGHTAAAARRAHAQTMMPLGQLLLLLKLESPLQAARARPAWPCDVICAQNPCPAHPGSSHLLQQQTTHPSLLLLEIDLHMHIKLGASGCIQTARHKFIVPPEELIIPV